MIGLLQRRRGIVASFVVACLIIVLLHPTPWGKYARTQVFGSTSNTETENTTIEEGEQEPKHPWTRLISGVDGFYVFENVYVRDRQLCEFGYACLS